MIGNDEYLTQSKLVLSYVYMMIGSCLNVYYQWKVYIGRAFLSNDKPGNPIKELESI